MATQKNNALHGMVGDVVCYTLHGQKVARSRPHKYRDRKSTKQLAQRERMRLANQFLSYWPQIVRHAFVVESKTTITSYNRAKSLIMRHNIIGQYPNLYLDYAKIRMSISEEKVITQLKAHRVGAELHLQITNATKRQPTHLTLYLLLLVEGDPVQLGPFSWPNNNYLTVPLPDHLSKTEEMHLWLVPYDPLEQHYYESYYTNCMDLVEAQGMGHR
ncbi:DUF6266 family protein [Halosquirtibacter xylanolyticus]|uniref:DUF6266 family protein n=1 Tax=Halosquirtibacter xylanolyticus TaxID=3374599 RepID=UPI003748A963|nr:DUF6266 family protein [Prolixibacteraceae bacterium]